MLGDEEKIREWSGNVVNNIMVIICLAIGIIGLLLTLGGKDCSFKILFSVIIIHSILMLVYGVYITANYLNEKNIRREYDYDIETLELKHEKERKAFEDEKEEILSREKRHMEAYDNLGSNHIYILDILQHSLHRLDAMHRDYLEAADGGQESSMALLSHIYDDYYSLLRDIINGTKSSIEEYLYSQGLEQKVSVTLKQFIDSVDTCYTVPAYQAIPYVYTAYCDYDSYRNYYRHQATPRLYTISKNTDFLQCMDKGSFLYHKDGGVLDNYRKEYEGPETAYNSGASTLIAYRSARDQRDKVMYGFLTCDTSVEQKEDWTRVEKEIALILEFSANAIAFYSGAIDLHWNQIADHQPENGQDTILDSKNFWTWAYHVREEGSY